FSVTSILLSTYMMFWLDLLDKYDFIDVLSENIFKLISLFICIILSLIFLGIVIFGLIHNLDLSYQSHKSRKNIKSFLDEFYYTTNDNKSEMLYKGIHNQLESSFQILAYALQNKMD